MLWPHSCVSDFGSCLFPSCHATCPLWVGRGGEWGGAGILLCPTRETSVPFLSLLIPLGHPNEKVALTLSLSPGPQTLPFGWAMLATENVQIAAFVAFTFTANFHSWQVIPIVQSQSRLKVSKGVD